MNRPCRRFALIVVAATACALGALIPGASAEPVFVITGCDSVEVSGQTYPRFAFELHNTLGGPIDNFHFQNLFPPTPPDTCHAAVATTPTGWAVSGAHFQAIEIGGLLQPGETLGGFSIALTSDDCCLAGKVVGKMELLVHETMCFRCDRPVPAQPSTWGEVKNRYR